MFEPKTFAKEAIPHALEQAERYRLLNEPAVAESICQNVLQVEPDHQQAPVTLILVTTDQFADNPALGNGAALELVQGLEREHEKAYYTGIIHESQGATGQTILRGRGSTPTRYSWRQ